MSTASGWPASGHVTYGLGTRNANLPGFVVMCPGGYPIVATRNWRSSFLPGAFQGTYLDTKETDPEKLIANLRNGRLTLDDQRRQLSRRRPIFQGILDEAGRLSPPI